jgi:hypothetical protein
MASNPPRRPILLTAGSCGRVGLNAMASPVICAVVIHEGGHRRSGVYAPLTDDPLVRGALVMLGVVVRSQDPYCGARQWSTMARAGLRASHAGIAQVSVAQIAL